MRHDMQQLLTLIQNQQAEIARLQQHPAARHPTIKLPPFSSTSPRLWFSQVEAQFGLHGVVDEATRYSYVVGQLDERGAKEVEDLIQSPPAEEPYSTLKTALISRVGATAEQRINQLLTAEELGDRTPSQFLRHLRTLSADVPDRLLRSIWTRSLPPQVRAIVQSHAVDPTISIQRLATIADDVLAVSPAKSSTFAIDTSPATTHSTSMTSPSTTGPVTVAAVSSSSANTPTVDELARQLSAVLQRFSRGRYPRSSTPPFRRDSSKDSRQTNDSDVCWFHQKFGVKARNCRAPCNFSKNSSSSRQ